ncbi:MAG: YHYH protein [Bacteroidia bacterium]|nr:YHYH protein [Bacteroidia bacterium]
MKKIINLLAFLLVFQAGFAHQGGHAPDHLKTWHCQDGSPAALGTLLMIRDQTAFIEDDHGKVIPLALDELSAPDQQVALAKQDRIKRLNGVAMPTLTHEHHSHFPWSSVLFYGAILLVLGLSAYRFSRITAGKSWQFRTTGFAGMALLVVFISCKKDDITDILGPNDTMEMAASFAPYSNVSTSFDSDYFYVESDGLAEHEMMVNITAWIAQVPTPQPYTGSNAWSIPIQPVYADNPLAIEDEMQNGGIALAVNGIPIFNPINASGLISKDIGELDDYGGHSGRGDDYHYHAAPLHLESTSGTMPIAWALDGFPVYGSKEPDGSAMESLDAYHGHSDGEGGYHYHGTNDYPFVIGAMRGEVTLNPNTTSPQTQIIPQPGIPALRPNPHGINSDNLIITACTPNGNGNGYLLEYTSQNLPGSVEYSWDASGLYTFIFHDINGNVTTETFQR